MTGSDQYGGRSRSFGGHGREDRQSRGPQSPPTGTPAFATLTEHLHVLDGRGYPAYKAIGGQHAGSWARQDTVRPLTLFVDRVQGDPFATPSRLRLVISAADLNLPAEAMATAARRVSTADFLARRLYSRLQHTSGSGSGKSGQFRFASPGQEILCHSRLQVSSAGQVEIRLQLGLPAAGRRILGYEASRLISHVLPERLFAALDITDCADALIHHLRTGEDAQALRAALAGLGLVAFVADGAILPRRSGVDDAPLSLEQGALPFAAPDELRLSIETPHGGQRWGMGIAEGITLIVGGGYHGKSTLLRAIERGVYDHIPGDGREFVVTRPGAVKVRAEEGRCIRTCDISNFIGNLPGGADTSRFFSDNASGSTSQAAAISEALEVGADCLLLDEDTSATNFMIRDRRMQELVVAADEPITPLIDRVAQLKGTGVSLIVVMGGAGDYFDVADLVLNMRAYHASCVTSRAKKIALEYPSKRLGVDRPWQALRPRVVDPDSLDARQGRREVHMKVSKSDRLMFGEQELELAAVEQIVDMGQTRAMALAVLYGKREVFGAGVSVAEGLQRIMEALDGDFSALQSPPAGDLAEFRIFELAAFLGRMRCLRLMKSADGAGG